MDKTLVGTGVASEQALTSEQACETSVRRRRQVTTTTRFRPQRKYHGLIELGRGGAAVVRAALATGEADFRKLVVLKTTRSEFRDPGGVVRAFMKEARIAARMSHPNIVHTYEAFQQEGLPVIVMEYLDGVSLARGKAFLHKDPAFDLRTSVGIIYEVLQGLEYAHSLCDYDGKSYGIVHRDVSPQNVMLTYDGQVKLVDFGIAKLMGGAEETVSGILKGKVAYMPPEQVQGLAVDGRVDLFAIGAMLWEAVAQRRLWGDLEQPTIICRLIKHEIPNLGDEVPDADPEIVRICTRALQALPENRYQSATEMLDDLKQFLDRKGGIVPNSELARLISRSCSLWREKTHLRLKLAIAKLDLNEEVEIQAEPFDQAPPSAVTIEGLGAGSHFPEQARSSRWQAITGLSLLGCAIAVLVFGQRFSQTETAAPQEDSVPVLQPSTPPRLGSINIELAATPVGAQLFLDDEALASNPFHGSFARDGKTHRLQARAPGHISAVQSLQFSADLNVSLALAKEPETKAAIHAVRVPARRLVKSTRRKRSHRVDVVKSKNLECDPPYTVDTRGIKRFKRRCLMTDSQLSSKKISTSSTKKSTPVGGPSK